MKYSIGSAPIDRFIKTMEIRLKINYIFRYNNELVLSWIRHEKFRSFPEIIIIFNDIVSLLS